MRKSLVQRLWLSWSWDCMNTCWLVCGWAWSNMVLWRLWDASTDPLVLYWKCCRYSCVYPGEGAGVSESPWKSQKYSIPLRCWSSEESQSCQLSIQCWAIIGLQANSMAFRWWPDVVTLTVSPIKTVKVGPLCQNIMHPPPPPHKYWGLTPLPLKLPSYAYVVFVLV